jgi:hypothetical protein
VRLSRNLSLQTDTCSFDSLDSLRQEDRFPACLNGSGNLRLQVTRHDATECAVIVATDERGYLIAVGSTGDDSHRLLQEAKEGMDVEQWMAVQSWSNISGLDFTLDTWLDSSQLPTLEDLGSHRRYTIFSELHGTSILNRSACLGVGLVSD